MMIRQLLKDKCVHALIGFLVVWVLQALKENRESLEWKENLVQEETKDQEEIQVIEDQEEIWVCNVYAPCIIQIARTGDHLFKLHSYMKMANTQVIQATQDHLESQVIQGHKGDQGKRVSLIW